LSPNARQIRDTAVWFRPADLAIDRVDQWVSPFGGFCSSVAAITFSTCSSVIVRGRPGRGSSFSPASRNARNRARHLPAVVLDIPSSAATSLTEPPSAQARMTRDRSARACAVFRRRAHPSRTWRSSSVSTTGSSFGLAIRQAYKLTRNYCLRTLATRGAYQWRRAYTRSGPGKPGRQIFQPAPKGKSDQSLGFRFQRAVRFPASQNALSTRETRDRPEQCLRPVDGRVGVYLPGDRVEALKHCSAACDRSCCCSVTRQTCPWIR